MKKVTGNKLSAEMIQILIGILVFGSIWGLLEATLGGVMHLVNFPNTGAIMSGVGMALMGIALAFYRKPVMLIGIGAIAATFKLLNVWILLIPANVPHIINPIAAIILEAAAFSLITSFLMNLITKSNYAVVWAAFLAGMLSAFSFALVAVYLTHIPINARVGMDSVREFVLVNGLVQSAFAGVFVPIGYMLGRKLATITPNVLRRRTLYYTVSASTVLLCWGFSALAVMVGL